MTELNNHLYNRQIFNDWDRFKKILPELAELIENAQKQIMTFNVALIDNFEDAKPLDEFKKAVHKVGNTSFDSKKVFEVNIDNTTEGAERIKKLYGDLPKLHGIDKNFDDKIEELQKKSGGKLSYNRYTFRFFPTVLTFIDKMMDVIEKLCGKDAKPIGPEPEKKIEPTPEPETIELPTDITTGLKSVNMEEAEIDSPGVTNLRKMHVNDDLAAVLKQLKREIARNKNELFPDKYPTSYRMQVREDNMGKAIFIPRRFEVVVFGDQYMRGAKLDKQGRSMPPGIGPERFTEEVFNRLGYKDALQQILSHTTNLKIALMNRTNDLKHDINILHTQGVKMPDEDSIRIYDRLITILENELKKVEHAVTAINHLSKEIEGMTSLQHETVKQFMKNMEDVAKSNIEWGGGEWGEDDNNVDKFVPALHDFKDIPEMIRILQDEGVKEMSDAIEAIVDAYSKIKEIDAEWRTHVEQILRMKYSTAA